VLSHINTGNGEPPNFPLPWATLPTQSFLATDEDTRRDLQLAGFQILEYKDVTAPASTQAALRQHLESEGMPPAGSHILAGEGYLGQLINFLRSDEAGCFRSVAVVAGKPPV
jgi:hypothetical protein